MTSARFAAQGQHGPDEHVAAGFFSALEQGGGRHQSTDADVFGKPVVDLTPDAGGEHAAAAAAEARRNPERQPVYRLRAL